MITEKKQDAEERRSSLERLFQVPARLKIMSALMVESPLDFTRLVEDIELSRGNLSMHMKVLREHQCVEITKKFIGNKPNTSYSITQTGKKDFCEYIALLEEIINSVREIR
jgi:DNA-binding transcriptional ArsR family regulator